MTQRRFFTIIMLLLVFFMIPDKYSAEKMTFYIDGQPIRYFGDVTKYQSEWYVPLIPVLQHSVERFDEEITASAGKTLYGIERLDYATEHYFPQLRVRGLNGREMLPISEAKKLGYEVGVYEEYGLLHFSSEQLLEIEGIKIGMEHRQVNQTLSNIHWNTAFGQVADYYGFYGEQSTFTYTDRYGIERTSDVSDIQLEITDGKVSHLIVSSSEYETSRGIRVGDRLFDATLVYGGKYIRDTFEGKQVVIYDVEQGSIWFIANNEGVIERIAFWDHWIEGFIEAAS